MTGAVIDVIELLVGAATLAVAWPLWRGGGPWFRVVAVVLTIAGLVAVAHAIGSLTG